MFLHAFFRHVGKSWGSSGRRKRELVSYVRLTEKQKRFADFYIETGNATEAYLKAGYKVKSNDVAKANASRLLTNANVSEYVANLMGQKDKERIASQDEILIYLTKVMRGETTEEVLRGEGKGFQTIDNMEVSAKDRIKAAELLGKRYTLWTDKQQIDANIGVTIVDDIDED